MEKTTAAFHAGWNFKEADKYIDVYQEETGNYTISYLILHYLTTTKQYAILAGMNLDYIRATDMQETCLPVLLNYWQKVMEEDKNYLIEGSPVEKFIAETEKRLREAGKELIK
jgi:hypothetical protein